MRVSLKLVQISTILHDDQKESTKNMAQISGRVATMIQVKIVEQINTNTPFIKPPILEKMLRFVVRCYVNDCTANHNLKRSK
jgi:hypothetical protein